PATGLYVPAGWWLYRSGTNTQIEWLDPVSGVWTPVLTSAVREYLLNSDGATQRIFNPVTTPVSGTVTAAGSGYAQANTIVTPNAGNSQGRAVVGGALASIVVGNNPAGVAGGSNFSVPPIVDIPAPPAGGVQATANATITAGAVTAVTIVIAGAGYT